MKSKPRAREPGTPDSRPDLYVVEASNLHFTRQVLDEFDARVMRCPDQVSPGVYVHSSKFMFLTPGINVTLIKEAIFARQNVRLHKHVAVLEPKPSGFILVEVFNVYRNKCEVTKKLNLSKNGNLLFPDMFPDFDMNVSSIVAFK